MCNWATLPCVEADPQSKPLGSLDSWESLNWWRRSIAPKVLSDELCHHMSVVVGLSPSCKPLSVPSELWIRAN